MQRSMISKYYVYEYGALPDDLPCNFGLNWPSSVRLRTDRVILENTPAVD
jgi:hypothetical protein